MKKFCERLFFFSSRRRHTRWNCDWSSDVCSSDLMTPRAPLPNHCASPSQESSHHARSASCCQSIKMYELRSEEHTSELQSQFHLVCRLLLEKKKRGSRGESIRRAGWRRKRGRRSL